jgi:hypothetical protein
MEPIMLAFTRENAPAFMEKMPMKSSGILPMAEFKNPPILGPVYMESCSVDSPSSAARGAMDMQQTTNKKIPSLFAASRAILTGTADIRRIGYLFLYTYCNNETSLLRYPVGIVKISPHEFLLFVIL